MKKLRRKFLAILMLILTLFSSFQGIVFAQTEISDAYIEYSHDTGHHLQYWNASKGRWSYVITSFVEYEHNGRRYPAYCANRERAGVDSGLEYSVNILDHLNDARIWRVIKNGYPYQTAQAMGVENDDDAFVATKHSVYSILYDIDVRAYYKGGDERGNKIVDAIFKDSKVMSNLNHLVEKEIDQYKTAVTSKKENTEQKQDQDEME